MPDQVPAVESSSASSGAPAPITLSEDALIIPPGGKEPVKFSEFLRGYIPQAEFTRMRQKDAEERRAWEAALQQAEQALLERARQLDEQLRAGQDPYSTLKDQPYLSGEQAVQALQALEQRYLQPLAQALQQRDALLAALYKRLHRVEQISKQVEDKHLNQAVLDRVKATFKDLGLPEHDALRELLLDLYSAYEGEDLDSEFPKLAKSRLEALRKFFRELDKQEAQKAREALLPGRGGQAAASQPAKERFEKPAEIANRLWPALHPSQGG